MVHDPTIYTSSGMSSKVSNVLPETRSTSRSAPKLKRRRSPSLDSVDSFAEVEEWEDPAKVFLATNPQFEVPLSELGRRATQKEHLTSIKIPPSAASPKPPHVCPPSPGQLPPSGSTLGPPGRNRSPESDRSDIPDETSTPPVMSNPELLDPLDAQAEDYQATQPLAEEDLNTNTTQIFGDSDSYARQSSPPAWSSTTSRPSTNTRTILGMVNPMKKWRHQRGQQLQLQAASRSAPDEQTQPSVDFSASSHAASAGRRLFEQLRAQIRMDSRTTPEDGLDGQNQPGLPVVEEASCETAVVSDSEPPEPTNMTSTPARPDSTSPKVSQRDRRGDSSLSPPTDAVIPDEISKDGDGKDMITDEDDDEEDDIPLCLTMGRPVTPAAPPSIKAGNPPKVSYTLFPILAASDVPEGKGRPISRSGKCSGS